MIQSLDISGVIATSSVIVAVVRLFALTLSTWATASLRMAVASSAVGAEGSRCSRGEGVVPVKIADGAEEMLLLMAP